MTTNMEDLEKKMEGMKAMMLDWFSGVDQKLTAIEERLKKIVDTQNQIGNQLRRINANVTEKNIGKGGIELSKNRDKGKAVEIRGGDGGSSHEYGPKKQFRPQISRDDDDDQYTDDYNLGPQGWVGLYTHHYGKDSPQWTDFGRRKNFCRPAWMGQLESDFRQIDRPPFGVKTGQDEIFKDSLKSYSSGKVADKTDAGGGEEEEEQTRSWATCGNTEDDKTDASLQDSLKSDQLAKNHASFGFKAMPNKINGESGGFMVANEGSNEKGHEEGQKLGSWGWKEEGLGHKRKHPDSPVEDRNNCPISSEPFTATRQRLNVFTSDEQEILNEIEPIMQSISRIMCQDGYNDGDPLSAEDQTYILDNVFNHHPDKAQKLGAGLDYIMVSKHMNFQGSRCFYIVSTDGRKEDFSCHKCLKNFVRGKYPDKADKFIPKYFKNSEPRYARNRDRGSGPDKAGTPRWSKWDRDARVVVRKRSPAWQIRAGHRSSFRTRRKRTP